MSDMRRGLEKPVIPALNDRNEIDLEQLGPNNLVTFIKYSGMKANDVVSPAWLGASGEGEAFDDVGAAFPVQPGDLENGLRVEIENATVVGARDGEAFYSYVVNGSEQSLREFCYIGVRERGVSEGLSVVHAIQSHNLVVKPDELETAGVTFVVSPYQAMQIGDKITFRFEGFDDSGFDEPPEVETLTVTKEHFSYKPLAFTVGKNLFRFIDPGYALVSYSIAFVDGQTAQSPVQRYTIDSSAALPDYLTAPKIVGHVPGDALDPGKFRDGLAITIDSYPGLMVSDRVILRWRSPVRELVQVMRVDASTQAVGAIILHVPAEFVLENQGLSVGLSYLFSREGAGQRSEELAVNIANVRELSALRVFDASPDEQKDHGSLPAVNALSGVLVEVPDVLQANEQVEVHWRGWPVYGEYIAKSPEGTNPRIFRIPAQYVPANMGRGPVDQSKRFEVAYRVIDNSGSLDSDPYHLRITPPPSSEYPRVSCEQAQAGSLSLARVPGGGADLTLGTWRFAREGQLVHLSISGVTSTGRLDEDIRDASIPVTASEAATGIKAKLDKGLLGQLKLGEQFTLQARLSFDGGMLYVTFPTLSLTLLR